MKRLLLWSALVAGARAIPVPALGTPPPVRSLPAPPPVVVAPARQATHLSYDQAPLLALANNPRITASLASVRESLAKAEVLAAPARPLGSLVLLGPPVPVGSAFRSDYVLSPVRLEISQLVYDGGRILAQIEQGKELARNLAFQAQVDWQQLQFEVREAYMALLTASSQSELAQKQVDQAQRQVEQAEARYRAGKSPRGDVLSAQLPLAEARLTLQRQQAQVEHHRENLNQLLGLAQETPLQLDPPDNPRQPLTDLSSCLQEAQSQQPSIKAAEHLVEAARKQIEAAELDNHPRITILVGTSANSVGQQVIGSVGYRGGFEVNWPFADGGRAAHLADQGRAVLEKTLAKLQEEKQMVELRVREAYRNLDLAVHTHHLEQARVRHAQDSLRIAQAQYRAGLGNLYAVRQAQTDLFQAESGELRAYHQFFTALAQLDLACGRSQASPTIPLPEGD